MTTVQKLVFSMLDFLEDQKQTLDPEIVESLEVATQCLEAAYGIDTSQADKYRVPMKLLDIFNEAVGSQFEEDEFLIVNAEEVTPESREEADKLKAQGNEFMKSERFEEALDAYSKAIQIDGGNAVYYCNRAAAFSKLDKHKQALNDCDRALSVEPNYGKAYGRKGLAHSALGQHQEAIMCYTKALELDPDNQSYKTNLDVSQQQLHEHPQGAGGAPAGFPGMAGLGGMGGMDFSSLMSNPAFMNMAQNVMQNPQMQTMMANLMGNMGGGGAQEGQAPDMGAFLRVGQQFAQQVQETNPELVEQIRRQANPGDPQPPAEGNKDEQS